MIKLTAKGTTELWRLKTCMADQLKDYEKKICAANNEDAQSRERREKTARSEEMARRRPSINREHAESHDTERASHHPNKEATPATVGCAGCVATGCPASARSAAGLSPDPGSGPAKGPAMTGVKEKRPVVLVSRDGATLSATVRAGASSAETPTLRKFSNARMTKLISTGGPMCLSLQLYTEGNVATWRQTDVPNYGHSGVLMMPVKRMPNPDQVDPAAMAWQATPASLRQVGRTEVVLRGVSEEPDARTCKLILFTDQATGKQSVRYHFQTGGQELSAKNQGQLSTI